MQADTARPTLNGGLIIARPAAFDFALCADDYAMTPGVSAGIIEALSAGSLSATSVMTTSPWWPESVAALKAFEGKVDIGLHLNFTLGAPLGPMPAFAPKGRFPEIGQLLRLARSKGFPIPEVAAELDRQLDRFAELYGRAPDHVDGHQHVQVLRPIRRLLLEALRKRGWTPWLRDSADGVLPILRRGKSLKKAAALAVVAGGFATEAVGNGLRVNAGFAGFSDFDPSEDYGRVFETYLRAPGGRHLVMCHPGHVDDALRGLDPVVETREQELAFLTSPDFQRLLHSKQALLRRLSAMP